MLSMEELKNVDTRAIASSLEKLQGIADQLEQVAHGIRFFSRSSGPLLELIDLLQADRQAEGEKELPS